MVPLSFRIDQSPLPGMVSVPLTSKVQTPFPDGRIAETCLSHEERTVPLSALAAPRVDPTPIFEAFRGNYGTELLTAAVSHFHVFGRLRRRPLPFDALLHHIGLEQRPT